MIACSGMESGEERAQLRALGVSEILLKPYSPQQLRAAIAAAFGRSVKQA